MSKSIRFEVTPRLATVAEGRNFGLLKKGDLSIRPSEGPRMRFDVRADFNQDKKEDFFTCTGYTSIHYLDCGVGQKTRSKYFSDEVAFGSIRGGRSYAEMFNLFGKYYQIISEVRYCDIDKDGDCDVAFKTTTGAIYVFHNLYQ